MSSAQQDRSGSRSPDLGLARTPTVAGAADLATPLRVAQAASARYCWPLHVIKDAADPTIDQPEAFLRALDEGSR